MHFATGHEATARGFLVFTGTNSASNFVDLLPLIEKTENLDFLRCLLTLQAESPSIFLDKSGRGRRLCERLQDSLIRRSSEKMDESVQFPVGQTGFLLTRMIIHLSGFSTAICMYK